MKVQNLIIRASILLFAALGVVALGRAQDTQTEEKPKPAAKSYGPIGAEEENQNPAPDTLQPDRSASDGLSTAHGRNEYGRHSYWVPGVSYYNFINSNGQTQGGGSGWNSTSYLSGT